MSTIYENELRATRPCNNQTALNNGCVCSHGCAACDALAEAWEAMREALQGANAVLTNIGFEDKRAIRREITAALALADAVMTRKGGDE